MESPVLEVALDDHLRSRLEESQIDPGVSSLVLAACSGADALDMALAGGVAEAGPGTVARARDEVWLTSLTVEGIRGIRGPLTLTLDPQPGLVVLAGGNGAGKSSLAEGMEALLLGRAERWRADQGANFGGGWQNLHTHGVRRVSATFRIRGRESLLQVERRWEGPDPEASRLFVDGVPADDVAPWGGRAMVNAWFPMLVCGQASRRLESDKPSDAFDALASVLGLDALATAAGLLQDRAKLFKDRADASDGERRRLAEAAEAHPDPRAARCAALFRGKSEPDHAAVLAVLAETIADEALVDLVRLRRRAALAVPSESEAAELARGVRNAVDDVEGHALPAAMDGERLVQLLEAALHVHGSGANDCPVCGTTGVLDEAWARTARERATSARESLSLLARARATLSEAERRAHAFLDRALGGVDLEALSEVDQTLVRAWRTGDTLRGGELARHLDEQWPSVRTALERTRDAAVEQVDRIQAAWRPLAAGIEAWLTGRAAALRDRQQAARLRDARAWLKAEEAVLRAARFAPVRDRALHVWRELRHEGSVELQDLAMEGSLTRRKLVLTADVDGVATSALRVASQGELNALTLSVFVPRAALEQSPFRFVVVDDPIQAMDAYRVDGLARVLGELASTRQVLVLTHDDRLLESLRCQGISATVIGVRRRKGSMVEARLRHDPIEQHLQDAERIVSAGELEAEVKSALVLGFCREAVEAALLRTVRRKSLRDGVGSTHDELEASLVDRPLRALGGLALLGDPRSGGRELNDEVYRRTQRGDLVTLLDLLNRGSHGGALPDDVRPGRVILQSRDLVELLAKIEGGA